jgi:hypothetical protein
LAEARQVTAAQQGGHDLFMSEPTDSPATAEPPLAIGFLASLVFGPLSGLLLAASLTSPLEARSVTEVVKAFCLSAFEVEMAQAGKTPPAGMAHFACDCVADRITTGSSINAARSSCRGETSRRFPL